MKNNMATLSGVPVLSKSFTRLRHVIPFRALRPQCDRVRHMEGRQDSVLWGRRAGSHSMTAKTSGRRTDGGASGSPTRKGRPPANGSPSGHRLTHKEGR